MSGECKSYRLNEPMAWAEFKAMPNDLQVAYIKAIMAKYNAPFSAIAKMLGVDRANLSRYLRGLGVEAPPSGHHKWEKMAFAEWCYGMPMKAEGEEAAEEVQQPAEAVTEDDLPWTEPEEEEEAPASTPAVLTSLLAVPESGSMTFTGDATRIMNTLVNLFGGANIKINVHWDVLEE